MEVVGQSGVLCIGYLYMAAAWPSVQHDVSDVCYTGAGGVSVLLFVPSPRCRSPKRTAQVNMDTLYIPLTHSVFFSGM